MKLVPGCVLYVGAIVGLGSAVFVGSGVGVGLGEGFFVGDGVGFGVDVFWGEGDLLGDGDLVAPADLDRLGIIEDEGLPVATGDEDVLPDVLVVLTTVGVGVGSVTGVLSRPASSIS